MTFPHTPLILHEKRIWAPSPTKKIESQKSFKEEVFSILLRRVERYEEMNEMEDLLHEAHLERISYVRELSSERNAIDREERRRKRHEEKKLRREQKAQLRREKNEQRRREQKAEILRYTLEQRNMIRTQARLFRQMKRDEEDAAKQREIAEGWKVVNNKRSKKNIQRSSA
jgi:hypothetical protein